MTVFAAFLRGVNLGKRTVKSADLKQAFADMGFAGAKPLLASGNVIFEADDDKDLAGRIETGLQKAFGFDIGTVIRSQADLQAMIDADPFSSIPADADAKLYVAMLHEPIGRTLKLPYGVPGDHDAVAVTDFDVFLVAWKNANGRYGEGLDKIDKLFGKGHLITTRNWNTIIKAAQAKAD